MVEWRSMEKKLGKDLLINQVSVGLLLQSLQLHLSPRQILLAYLTLHFVMLGPCWVIRLLGMVDLIKVLSDTGCNSVVARQELVPEEQLTGGKRLCIL